VAPLRLAGKVLDLAHIEATDVQRMDTEVENDETFLAIEVRLPAVDVVAGPERDAGPGGLADDAGGNRLAHAPKRRLETEVLVYRQKYTGPVGRAGHRDGILPFWRERLLHDRRDAFGDRFFYQHAMRIHPRDDIEEVDLLPGNHLVEIGVGMGNVEFLCRRP